MNQYHWTKKQARAYMVKYHFLNLKEPLESKAAIKTIFDRLFTIQYDPLDCVGRNPDLVLQARIKNYKKDDLHNALYQERYLMDGWDKQMSLFKSSDYPYFDSVRKDREKVTIASLKHHHILEALDYNEAILQQIKTKGPLFSREIDIENARWKHGKLTSVALDYLFLTGQIVVYNKSRSQKQFELVERVFQFEQIEMTEDAFIMWYLKRRMRTLGFFWNKGTAWSGLYIQKKAIRTKYIKRLLEEEFIVEVKVEDIKEPFYAIKEYIENKAELKKQITILAPLDNINWDRELIYQIFDFDYKWEVYVPKTKRKFGYYVLPLLYKDELIGRIEFENHKKGKPLKVIGLWFESKINVTKTIKKALDNALRRFSRYLEASDIQYESTILEEFKWN